jgi:hypothetical protein
VLAGVPLSEPASKDIDPIGGPGAVARHRARFQAAKDGGCVLADILIRPEVEVTQH